MTTSLSKSRHHLASEGQPGSVVWFISFGDLLTLLLCFFLVLTPWDRLKKPSNAQSLPTVNGQSEGSVLSGTTFASDLPLRGSVIKLELPLFEDAGGLSGDGLSSAALSEELKRAMPNDARVDVLVCSGSDDRATVVRFVGEAFERSFGSAKAVRFVVKRSCDESRVLAPVTKKVVGRIRIVGT
jgi:hypothetical protein